MFDLEDSLLIRTTKPGLQQIHHLDSFIGGSPKLPDSLDSPTCQNCHAVLTFFFQVAFPEGKLWAGRSLAVFACTQCEDEKHPTPYIDRELIPSMLKPNLDRGETVPDGALEIVQRTFRFLVFPTRTGILREDYPTGVQFRPIFLRPNFIAKRTTKSKVGGLPGWLAIDQTPGDYLGEPLEFLMQWRHHFTFTRAVGSPAPFSPVLKSFPGLTDKDEAYKLFIGSQLYFFGNLAHGSPNVMMIPFI